MGKTRGIRFASEMKRLTLRTELKLSYNTQTYMLYHIWSSQFVFGSNKIVMAGWLRMVHVQYQIIIINKSLFSENTIYKLKNSYKKQGHFRSTRVHFRLLVGFVLLDRCLSLFFWLLCSSSIIGFWLPLLYFQTLLHLCYKYIYNRNTFIIALLVLNRFTIAIMNVNCYAVSISRMSPYIFALS
jgi:hypothetical protein